MPVTQDLPTAAGQTQEALALARLLWDYHHMGHRLQPSDIILALGSHDLRVADRAAELYHQGWAPRILFSGGLGNFTKELWTQPEADLFAARARSLGVPLENILIENQSTNTGENIQFSKKILEQNHLSPTKLLLVQKPYMERRTFATVLRHWPEKDIRVTSPQIPFEQYPNEEIPLDRVIHIMVGDLERIIRYPALGFQIPQEVPDSVLKSFQRLKDLGYTHHLMVDNNPGPSSKKV